VHPSTKKFMEFCVPPPKDIQGIIDYLEKGGKYKN
jgi:hypothetical protein